MSDPGNELQVIDRDECLELLAQLSVGRVAAPLPGEGPHVVPVNYALVGDLVVFRTDPGTKLHLLRQFPISFQVDLVDPNRHVGWSVLVKGLARELDPEETAGIELQRWTGGGDHWIGLPTDAVSGRRIAPVDVPQTDRGYL